MASNDLLVKIEVQHESGTMIEFYKCEAVSVHRTDEDIMVIISFCDGGRLDWHVDNVTLGNGWAGQQGDAVRLTVAGKIVDLTND